MKTSSHWRHKHKKIKIIISFSYVENIDILGYLGAWEGGGGASIIIILYFVRGHVGTYIKSRGTRGTKMSANAAITMEIYVYNKGKQFENQFFIYEPKFKNKIYFGLFRGP